jgi:hypothetical protein
LTGAFLLSGAGFVLSNPCDSTLVAAMSDPNIISVTQSTDVSRRELKKELEQVKLELKNDLRVAMGEQVLLDVKSTTTSSVMDAGGSLSNTFISETEVSSAAVLTQGRFYACVLDKQKVVYGIYTLDRAETAASMLLDCENRMERLIAEVESISQSSDIADPLPFEHKRDKVRQDARVVVYLDRTSDLTRLNRQLGTFEHALNTFKGTSDRDVFNAQYQRAESRLNAKDFPAGIQELRAMQLDFPQRKEISNLLDASLRRYTHHTESIVARFVALKNYTDALAMLDEYCSVVDCEEKTIQRRASIAKDYFDHAYVNFEAALKARNKKAASNFIATLEQLAASDPKTYQAAKERYNIFLIEEEMRAVQIEIDRENYHLARLKVNKIEADFGSTYRDVQLLKKSTEQKLLRSEIQKEKQTRRMLFSFVMGVEAISNKVDDYANIDSEVRTFGMGYSAGLYKKLNYAANSSIGTAASAELIGIKFRVQDTRSTVSFSSAPNVEEATTSRYNGELMLDGTLLRVFHYAAGAVFMDLNPTREPIPSVELGFRVPVAAFSFQLNARALYIDPKPDLMMTAGIFYQLDFKRQFGRKDKSQIQYRLEL